LSGRQRQMLELVRKGKEKEMTAKETPTSQSAKDKDENEAIQFSLNNKTTVKDRESTNGPNKDLLIPDPFQVRQGTQKEMVCYDVISHLQ